jgi:hypothetical protein
MWKTATSRGTMQRNVINLIKDLKRRAIDQPITRAEADTLIAALEQQTKAERIAALRAQLRRLIG